MLEIRCLIEDKRVSEALRALKGLTVDHPVVLPYETESAAQPAPSPQATKPARRDSLSKYKRRVRKDGRPVKVGGHHSKGKGAAEVVRTLIAQSDADHITAREVKRAVMAAGYSTGSYSNALKLLQDEGAIKAMETIGDYRVVRPANPETVTAEAH